MNCELFENLALIKPILRALADEGYHKPTHIQQRAIPLVLARRDLLATAQTGTGKTAAFALPMLQWLHEQRPNGSGGKSRDGNSARGGGGLRALILTPTRELALQIDENLRAYGRHLPLRSAVVLGGVSAFAQIKALRKRPDILVATPGRLLDLMSQRHVHLNRVEMLVLDEADRMLDMGFVHDVRKIIDHTPSDRQTLLFSATLSKGIAQLADQWLRYPSRVSVTPSASVSGKIEQKVLFVDQPHKRALLADVLKGQDVRRALVFTRTKHGADRIARVLLRAGISSDAIHSNKTQRVRQRVLAAFDRGRIQVLVATDIVARGIDVDGISHVINYELPNDPESYVHRIGRTARAGAVGVAMSFCDASEVPMLQGIEKLTNCPLVVVDDHPFHSVAVAALRTRHRASWRKTSQRNRSPQSKPQRNRRPRRGRVPHPAHSSS